MKLSRVLHTVARLCSRQRHCTTPSLPFAETRSKRSLPVSMDAPLSTSRMMRFCLSIYLCILHARHNNNTLLYHRCTSSSCSVERPEAENRQRLHSARDTNRQSWTVVVVVATSILYTIHVIRLSWPRVGCERTANETRWSEFCSAKCAGALAFNACNPHQSVAYLESSSSVGRCSCRSMHKSLRNEYEIWVRTFCAFWSVHETYCI